MAKTTTSSTEAAEPLPAGGAGNRTGESSHEMEVIQ
jgi:hypothetical protein